ncbi:MAG: NUDIX hydrolase [Patescibacteria group bacterium]|nr:NUDIX hydrolase [Patescibacteria group bacterium]
MIERVVQEIPKRLVSRSFVMALAQAKEIYQYLFQPGERLIDQKTEKPEDFSFLRFLLAKKTSPEKEGERLTFFGGNINPNEDVIEAVQREIIEELGITTIGIGDSKRFPITLFNLGEYNYYFRFNGQVISRRLILNGIYVLPDEDGTLVGDKKIKDVISVSLEDLINLVNGGDFDGLSLEEHLRLNEKGSRDIFQNHETRFFISPYSIKLRRRIFNESLKWFEHINNYLKRRFEKIKEENPNMTFDDFKKVYRKELLRFMKNGIEKTLKRKDIVKEGQEEETKIISEESSSEEALKIKEGLNRGFLGTDILYFLPQIIEGLLEGYDLNFLLSDTTEATQAFFQYFSNFLREKNQQIKEIRKANTLEERNRLISEFNSFLLEILQQDFGISKEEIDLTFAYFHNFWGEIENTLKNADPNLTQGLVQNYRLLNEVSNASLGKLILLMFGIIGFNREKTFQKQLMFEAGRQLVLIMKGFLSVRYFFERTSSTSLDKISSAIESFFGKPVNVNEVVYQNEKGQERKIIANMRNGNIGPTIVDQKPPKSWFSYLRKAFKEMPEKIEDYLSYSIVYLGEKDKDYFIRDLINDNFKEKLKSFLEFQFPTSRIEITEKSTFGLREFVQGTKKQEGKRTGSQGKRIVAMKYRIKINNQIAELLIYPYLSTVRSACDDNGWWMGWLEKRNDDDDYVVRRMLAGEKGIPSFYDLLFPFQIYPQLYLDRLRSNYHL